MLAAAILASGWSGGVAEGGPPAVVAALDGRDSPAISAWLARKVSPVIAWRKGLKEDALAQARNMQELRKALAPAGVAEVNPTAARCAVYVDQQLDANSLGLLQAAGAEIDANLYVPPVPGKHPLGFYLATIPYAAVDAVAAQPFVRRICSVEGALTPLTDVTAQLIGADLVHAGMGVAPLDGSGVKLAIADSGLDLTHPDIPVPVEAFDMTDGVDPATWGLDVSNTVTDHGTHVTGIAVESGAASGGKYMGMAPGADLYFYKVGDDVTATASEADTIEAICRAKDVGADVLSMSLGGFSLFMDGSEPLEQAVDAAVAAGMTVVAAAGNEAAKDAHTTAAVPPGGASSDIVFFFDNTFPFAFRKNESFRIVWRDDVPGDLNLHMELVNVPSSASPVLLEDVADVSARGTETRQMTLLLTVPPGGGFFTLRLTNAAATGQTPTAHVYALKGAATFSNPDPSTTVLSPALADSAIAVGAWVHRDNWINASGQLIDVSSMWPAGALAGYSSRGPRIDGLLKPDVTAPGCYTIAARDSTPGLADKPENVIDNDGLNLNGSGPAQYFARAGTSMAAPVVAGTIALMLQANPTLSPSEVYNALTSTAGTAATPNNDRGFGMIDALSAVQLAQRIGMPGDATR
ncbi:MAG: hypothetical protein D6824_05115, partial [Planctomycetota bacterium]